MAVDEGRALEKLVPKFLRLLNVADVKPHLMEVGVITYDEYEELQLGPHLKTQTALADRLWMIMRRKGPNCATQLLLALQKSVSPENPQSSHYELIRDLKRELGVTDIPSNTAVQVANDYNGAAVNGAKDSGEIPSPVPAPSIVVGATDHAGPTSDFSASNEPVPLMQYEPYLSSPQQEKLRVTLAKESQLMLEDFTTFVMNVGSLLQSHSISLDRVQLALQCRIGKKNVSENLLRKIDEAKSIPVLLRAALPLSSWYNYNLLAYLAKHLGGAEGESLVGEYEGKLQSYFERLVYECPPFSSIEKTPSDFQECPVKLDWDYRTCTIQDITLFKGRLCELLGQQDPTLFILQSVEEGCVLLLWMIPDQIATPDLCSKAVGAKAELAKLGVISFRIAAEEIISQHSSQKVYAQPEVQYPLEPEGQELQEEARESDPLLKVTVQSTTHDVGQATPVARPGHISNLSGEKYRHTASAPSLPSPLVYAWKVGTSPTASPPLEQRKEMSQQMKVPLREKSSHMKRILRSSESGYISQPSSQRSSLVESESPSRQTSDRGYSSPADSPRSSMQLDSPEEPQHSLVPIVPGPTILEGKYLSDHHASDSRSSSEDNLHVLRDQHDPLRESGIGIAEVRGTIL